MNKIILISIIFLLSFQIVFGQNKDPIKAGILNGKAIQMPKPHYPQKAKDLCVGGKVEVEVLVSETGDVIEAKAISGDELLRDVSVAAAKKVKFSQNSHFMVKVRGILIYNFDPFVKCVGQQSDVKEIKLISDLTPKVISLPKPNFPGGVNVSGTVSVIVTIDEKGNVINAEAVSDHPLLRPFAEKTAMKAKFEPVLISGKPIKIRFPIAYIFRREDIPSLEVSEEKQTSKSSRPSHPCGILTGKAIKLFKPPFLTNYRNNFPKNKKSVIVSFVIDEKGFVEPANATSENSPFRTVSIRAIKKSKFSPSFNCNIAVKAYRTIIYDFVRQKNGWQSRVININYELKLEK